MNYDKNNNNIKDCLIYIDNSEYLKEVINNYMFMIWKKKDLFKMIYHLTNKFYDEKKEVSFFYLDSFDLDWKSPGSSCEHHLKELVSIKKILKKETLVVVDDSPMKGYLQQSKLKKGAVDIVPFGLVPKPTISGKGTLVHEYAMQVGAKVLFSNYQTGWIGFN